MRPAAGRTDSWWRSTTACSPTSADRVRAQQIRDGREGEWKDLTVAQIEDAGQQELMTWICVAGAMHELGLKGDVIDYVETAGVFNSGKCLAVWRP